MNFNWRTLSIALLGLAAAAAFAAPQQYATSVQNIRCGVVILDSAEPIGSSAPFAFYNLNSAVGIKPVSWNLYNPHAAGSVTAAMYARWQAIQSVITGTDLPVVGAPITKRNAEYWSVYLDQTTDTSLSDYDVLLLNPVNTVSLNAYERERLTKFVDQGGILWIDPGAASSIDPANSFPLSFTLQATAGNAYANTFSPLLSTPFTLTGQDLNTVSGTEALTSLVGTQAVTLGGVASYDVADPAEFFQYLGVAAIGSAATISIGHIGDGEIIVTTEGTSQILNRSSGTSPYSNPGTLPVNDHYTAAIPTLETDGQSAAKLAVNIILQLQSYPQAGGGARKTGGSTVDVTAPVLSNWYQESVSVQTAPVVYKGVTVASTGSTITVYSSNPGSDLDHDGNPDDGMVDYSLGTPYDVIWTSTAMQAPLSTPVCAEVPDGYNGVKDVVMVIDSAGTLHVFRLFPENPNGQLLGPTQLGPLYSVTPPPLTPGFAYENVPNAPTVSGDLAFIADATAMGGAAQGRLWVVDLSTGSWLQTNTQWVVGGGNTVSYSAPGYTASPTVGYIPIQDGSGGYDKVVYAPGITGGNEAPCFNSVWFGTKDESPAYTETGGTLTISTRLITNGVPSGMTIYYPPSGGSVAARALGPRVTFLAANGEAINPNTVMTSAPTDGGPGVISVGVNDAAFNGANQTVFGVRVDYTIDWGNDPDTLSGVEERGRVVFPMPTTVTSPAINRRVLGSLALSPAGTLCMTVADPNIADGDNEGSLWWIRENKGRGGFQVAGRWALYPGYTIPSSPTATSVAVFDDQDPLTASIESNLQSQAPAIANAIASPMSQFHWSGGPVIEGNQVIATATAFKGGIVPVTLVMTFAAEPLTPQFQASNFTPGFSLVQADFDKSSPGSVTGGVPDQTSTLQQSNFDYDSTSGTLQITNLANFSGAQMTDCLSLSQPVIVRGGAADVVFQPETSGGTWAPLHWYCIFDGNVAQSRPLVTGNTIFFASNSVLPNLLTAGTFQYQGVVNAMDATIAASDPYALPSTARPYETQVCQEGPGSNPFSDPHIKMPSGSGISKFSDYQTRLVQQILSSDSSTAQASGVVGGGTNLAAWGSLGIYGLSRADFIICDQGRVINSDSSGNITFASNASLNTGPGGGSTIGNVNSLVRPTRAYSLSPNEMLIVDPGSNRVVKENTAGQEERAVDHFILDPNYKPAGYVANEPRTFSAPQDAVTWSDYYPANGVTYQPAGYTSGTVEYWVHYLVADSGNHRLLELIDRYSVNGNGQTGPLITVSEPNPNVTPAAGATVATVSAPQIGVLVWQSPANVSGKNFAYNSISRLYLSQTTNTGGRYVYVAGVGNAQPTLANGGTGTDTAGNLSLRETSQTSTGNGGVVVFDPLSPNGLQVYNNFDMPSLTSTPFWSNANASWVTNTGDNTPAGNRSISGLNSVTAKSVAAADGNGGLQLMITEATGVYEFIVDPTQPNTTGDLGSPDWFINNAAYTELRSAGNVNTSPGGLATNPAQFHAAYAKRLGSGDVMIVNSYNGVLQGGLASPFKGEVLMLNGISDGSSSTTDGEFQLGKQNLGFYIRSIKFNFPTPIGVRGIVAPIFADRR